jgi:1-acyl-sn-glycerol-3-phosphate acyltransferase
MPLLRAILKFAGFLWITARALFDFWFNVRKRSDDLRERAAWCHRWAKAYIRLLNVELKSCGSPPAAGLLTCNHLSYLDIVLLAAIRPQMFLSKAEVRNWPVIGALTRCAGTLFIRRDRKSDVAELQRAFTEVVEQGIPLTLFPEGTSSDGSGVLPFYSSLLEPAARAQWPVAPGWISYRLDALDGSVSEDICYWRDMTFGPHFLKLLSKKKIYATVVFGEAVETGLSRKEMALELRNRVIALAAAHRDESAPATEVGNEELQPALN